MLPYFCVDVGVVAMSVQGTLVIVQAPESKPELPE